MIVYTLKEYLARLEREQLSKKEGDRNHVPNFSELAEMAGLTFKTISKIANNTNTRSLNFQTGNKIIKAMRKRGFDMTLSDLIIYQDD